MCENKEYVNLINGDKLNNDMIIDESSMLNIYPYLWEVWDFESNEGISIYEIKPKSHKNVNWICRKCNSKFDMRVENRTKSSLDSCPYCNGKRVNDTNSLEFLNPKLAKDWNYSKNENLTPKNVTLNSSRKVWWNGECGHEWEATVNSRNKRGSGCPYCSGRNLLIGYSDMWTTDRELASMLLNPKDGFLNMRSTNKKLDWKCPKCKEVIKGKTINNVSRDGLRCHICKDSMSFGEKILYQLLKLNNVEFNYNKSMPFSKNKRYDFIIEDSKLIIEVHGKQHYYNVGFETIGGRCVSDEIKNDKLKMEIANSNGYEYVEIDCRFSDFEFIKNNIIKSKIKKTLKIQEDSFKLINMENSLVTECWELYSKGMSKIDISKTLKIGRNTVSKYIKLKNIETAV